jgi:ribonuclease inhibitor
MKTCILDGSQITDRKLLHQTLAASLDFPDWYGNNLDALYDCLTDIREETKIMIQNSANLETNLGRYANSLYRVLNNVSKDNPFLTWQKI